MTNQKIINILKSKGVVYLYHSNTVETSLSFLNMGGLLSRGCCEDYGLPQTPQQSDQLDRDFGIYYDIFFDSIDIHERAHNVNYYGPVLFIYDIDVLDTIEEECIRITKDNPQYWKNTFNDNDKYFIKENELNSSFIKGNFNQHITITSQHTPLSFSYLQKIVISNPHNACGDYYQKAFSAIHKAINDNHLDIQVEERICADGCSCTKYYAKDFLVRKHYKFGGTQ